MGGRDCSRADVELEVYMSYQHCIISLSLPDIIDGEVHFTICKHNISNKKDSNRRICDAKRGKLRTRP